MTRIVAIVLFLAGFPLYATTLPRLEIAELFELSDIVVLAQIESGRVLKTKGDYSCGAEYGARVLDSMKGKFKKGDLISFGPYSGEQIGGTRILFLSRTAANLSLYSSTNSVELNEESLRYKKCRRILPKYSVIFSGFGSVEVSFTMKFDYEEGVILKNQWLASPVGMETKMREPGDNRIISDRGESWVRLGDFVKYLHSLNISK
jgi:hypothetical protein